MDKIKNIWAAFVHWPLWRKFAAWSGWTIWLKWPVWRRIGAWSGWKKLLFPHPLLVGALTVLSAAGLFWAFFTGNENSIPAYLLYTVAFYALVILIARIVKMIPLVKQKTRENPVFQKLKGSKQDGAFDFGFYLEQFINFVYGVFKIASGIWYGSAWIGADGIYNFSQGLIQLYQILRHKKDMTRKQQWRAYRQCGYMMIALHLTMTGMVFQMIHMGRHEDYSEIMIIATAAFTFYKLIVAFVDMAKDRKHENPVDSSVHFLNFSQAIYNLFVLQVGLLWVFGGSGFAPAKLMNSLTGGAVCLLVCSMGIYMLWRSNRDMKKREEENG